MRITYLIFLSFVFILLLFTATTYINYRQSEKVRENTEYMNMSTDMVRNANRFQRNILNMVSGLRGFLITGENYFLQAYDSASAENSIIIKEISAILPDTSANEILLAEIDSIHMEWITRFTLPLRNAKINAEASEQNVPFFNRLYREKMFVSEESRMNVVLQNKVREFINLEYKSREVRQEALTASIQETKKISFSLTILSIIAGFSVVAFLVYRIKKRITKMTTMADTIASGNFSVHTDDHGTDELSGLARSLNHMARMLNNSFSELKRKNQELDQFAHIVSHDMKTPLRGIGNVVEWIEEDHKEELTPKVEEYLGLIKGRVERGENLIQGLLSYARIGKEKEKFELVNLSELIDEILENYTGRNLKVIKEPNLPVFSTHKVPLFHVLANLISNAIKYNDKQMAIVSIYHREYESHYEFFVEDNGPGINEAYHQKIFVIFQTLHDKGYQESTGVGLAIVKKILDSRNETISINSVPGEGTVFSFTWKKTNYNE
jgi:signal transduction histidine kinase